MDYQATVDLLVIPGVTEEIIKNSLLKGNLYNKLRNGDLTFVNSNIDLLQFSDEQKEFLTSVGIVKGLNVESKSIVTRDLGILFIGDSHVQGVLSNVLTTATSNGELMGLFPFASPRDKSWDGTAFRSYFPSVVQYSTTLQTNSLDPNLGQSLTNGSFTSFVPPMLRAGYLLGDIRLASAGIGGACSYTWSADQAQCVIDIASLPLDGDTFIVGTQTYTWRTTPSQAYDIQIADTTIHCARNLECSINGEGATWTAGGANTGTIFAGTLNNTAAYCPNARSDKYAKLFATVSGVAGNLTVTTFSSARMTFLKAWVSGNDTAVVFNNMATLTPSTGFGKVDVVCICLGTNDIARTGWRGRYFQTELTKIVANLRSTFGNDIKIIIWKAPWSSVAERNTYLTTYVHPAVDTIVATDPTNISSIDMYALGQGTGNSAIVSPDGTHLTRYGYMIAAQMFARAIASALSL